jgi:hypothetical protein
MRATFSFLHTFSSLCSRFILIFVTLVSCRWGILHTEKFWRENARLLEGDNFKVLKALIALLGSRDAVSVIFFSLFWCAGQA